MTTIPLGVPYKDALSIINSQKVLEEVRQRFPDWAPECRPYVNVLPLRAWNERGYRVRKGEKAIRVFTQVPVLKRNEQTGEDELVGARPAMACVFALPQVQERRGFLPANTHTDKPEFASSSVSPPSGEAKAMLSPTPSTSGTSGTSSGSSTP